MMSIASRHRTLSECLLPAYSLRLSAALSIREVRLVSEHSGKRAQIRLDAAKDRVDTQQRVTELLDAVLRWLGNGCIGWRSECCSTLPIMR